MFLVSMALFLLLTPLKLVNIDAISLRGNGLNLIVTGVVYFIWTFFALKRFSKNISPISIFLVILTGASLIDLIVRIIDFRETLISLPEFIGRILAIAAGYAYYRVKSRAGRISLIAVMCLIFGLFAFQGYRLLNKKLNFGTVTGKVYMEIPADIIFQDSAGGEIILGELGGTYLVLDFWHSRCGACFNAFPEVQELYDRFSGDDRVALYGVFCRMEDSGETFATGRDILSQRGYTFPLLLLSRDNIPVEFDIRVYPTVLIVESGNKIIFKGRIADAERYLMKLLEQ